MQKLLAYTLLLCPLWMVLMSCNDPTDAGFELVEKDLGEVFFTDDFSIKAKSIDRGALTIYDPEAVFPNSSYLCGQYEDDYFGNYQATIFAQLGLGVSSPTFADPAITNVRFDSAIMTLAYDTLGFYGNYNQAQSLEIYKISEMPERDSVYKSDQSFGLQQLVSRIDFVPQLSNNSVSFPVFSNTGSELISFDSLAYTSDSLFFEQFTGLAIKATKNTNTFLNFALNNSSSGIRVYYTIDDTTNLSYQFNFIGFQVRSVFMEQDYSGAALNDFLDDFALGDSLLFISGMAGPDILLEISGLDQLQDKVINKAELTIVTPDIPGNKLPLVSGILASKPDVDGGYEPIEDVAIAINQGNLGTFGGALAINDSTNYYQYDMNLTAHIQDVIDGIESNEILLSPSQKISRASRTLIFGPGNKAFPINLRITYTNK